MCVIAYGHKRRFKDTWFDQCCEANPDGFFVARIKPGNHVSSIRTMDRKEARAFFDKADPPDLILLHARIKSVGPVCLDNVHGWKAKGVYFCHNGTLSLTARDKMTDSETFFRDIFLPIYEAYGRRFTKRVEQAIFDIIGSSRVAFIEKGTVRAFGDFTEKDGCWFSNTYWDLDSIKTNYLSSYRYSPAAWPSAASTQWSPSAKVYTVQDLLPPIFVSRTISDLCQRFRQAIVKIHGTGSANFSNANPFLALVFARSVHSPLKLQTKTATHPYVLSLLAYVLDLFEDPHSPADVLKRISDCFTDLTTFAEGEKLDNQYVSRTLYAALPADHVSLFHTSLSKTFSTRFGNGLMVEFAKHKTPEGLCRARARALLNTYVEVMGSSLPACLASDLPAAYDTFLTLGNAAHAGAFAVDAALSVDDLGVYSPDSLASALRGYFFWANDRAKHSNYGFWDDYYAAEPYSVSDADDRLSECILSEIEDDIDGLAGVTGTYGVFSLPSTHPLRHFIKAMPGLKLGYLELEDENNGNDNLPLLLADAHHPQDNGKPEDEPIRDQR